jgi:hypothetical protein
MKSMSLYWPPVKRYRLKSGSCPNCGHLLAAKDNYCRNCGQENHDLRIPFGHLLFEALEGVFHFDNKLFRTAKSLLFRPGFLTSQFSNGRRASYVPPVRLYIFLSFIFFLLLTFSPGKHRSDEQNNLSGTMQADSSKSDQFNLSFYSLNSIELKGLSDAQIDSVMEEKGIERTGFERYIAGQLARIANGGKAEFLHNLLKSISYMMFVLMPIFALLLYLFFRKRVDYYLNCLVFSIHFHSFVFLLFTIYVVLSWFVSSVFFSFGALLIMTGYFYIALRTVYGQSRLSTILKMLAIGVLHIFAILGCFLIMV